MSTPREKLQGCGCAAFILIVLLALAGSCVGDDSDPTRVPTPARSVTSTPTGVATEDDWPLEGDVSSVPEDQEGDSGGTSGDDRDSKRSSKRCRKWYC